MFALGTIVWLAALGALILYCPKYLPDGELLLSSDFEGMHKKNNYIYTQNFACWHCTKNGVSLLENAGFASSTGVKLTPAGKWGSSIQWDLTNPQRFSFLEFRGRMRVENIMMGEASWQNARFLVCFKDREGVRHWDYPHIAGQLSGYSPWIEFSNTFQVPDFAVSAHVLIQNSGKSGTMWVDDISLRPARLNSQYFRNRNILLGWGVALALAFIVTFKIWGDFGWVPITILAACILGVLCPEVYIEKIANNFNIKVAVLKKVGHLLIFLVIGTAFPLCFRRRLSAQSRETMSITFAVLMFMALALFAAMTEFLQLLTIDRTPNLSNYLVDICGILTGILLAFIVAKKRTQN
jgi:hypothetical protein